MENLLTGVCVERIKRFESIKRSMYKDNRNNWTIGIGFNLSDNSIPDEFINIWGTACIFKGDLFDEQIDLLFSYSLKTTIHDLSDIFTWDLFNELSYNRQYCLVDMCFNMGKTRFMTFKNMIKAVIQKKWVRAAQEIRKSKYYDDCVETVRRLHSLGIKNTFNRAKDNMRLMEIG